jgi:pimeloyl-ACP methyl ester carboxylesterase
MESSVSLHDVYHSDRTHNLSKTTQVSPLSGMKQSASQAYFDRYPERRGKSLYIPSPKLTKGGEAAVVETQDTIDEDGAVKGSSRRSVANATLQSERQNPREVYTEKRRPVQRRVASSSTAEKQAGSTSSTSYASTFFSGSSPGQALPRRFPRSRAEVIADNPSGSSSIYPSPPSTSHRTLSTKEQHAGDTLNVNKTPTTTPSDSQEEAQRLAQNDHLLDSPRRRLRAQLSMPNVKVEREDEKIPVLPSLSQRPFPVTSASYGRGPKPQGNGSPFPQASSSNFSSIDDIVRRNTPDIVLPKSASSNSDVFTQSLGRKSILKKAVSRQQEEDPDSDSSLDSIEREIRHSMRTTTLSDETADESVRLNSSGSDKFLTTSPSTSTFFGKTKARASMLNPVKRLQTPPTASIGPSDSSPTQGRRFSKKYLNLSIPSPSTSNSTSPVQSPSTLSPPPSASCQDDEIRSYLQSKKLTTLMTLSRLPFQGLTVSFADVGDPDGHPVFVFLGLGAVRYLVGLYDEMATVLHLRLICIDRWGLGKTDDLSAEKRGVMEWSTVVVEVADRLQIDRFSLLAHSAGAPYAMATCLVHEERIAGPVHLLAPWVGSTVESGYKWLKYIPDGVIKTAQAADWRMQAWKLGLGKSPSIVHLDDRSASREEGSISRPSVSPSSSQNAINTASATPTSKYGSLKKSRSAVFNADTTVSNLDASGWDIIREAASPSVDEPYMGNIGDSLVSPPLYQAISNGNGSSSASSQAQHFNRMASETWSNLSDSTQTPSYSVSDLTTAVMRASHAETLRGGATNDLLVILGRSSQKPWGFSYTDIMHKVVVWQGDKDERISLSSIMWMEREMKNCSVNLVKNASHSLMTNVAVVIEALER